MAEVVGLGRLEYSTMDWASEPASSDAHTESRTRFANTRVARLLVKQCCSSAAEWLCVSLALARNQGIRNTIETINSSQITVRGSMALQQVTPCASGVSRFSGLCRSLGQSQQNHMLLINRRPQSNEATFLLPLGLAPALRQMLANPAGLLQRT